MINIIWIFYIAKSFFYIPTNHTEASILETILNEYGFTNREKEVAALLLKGLKYTEISDTLFISIKTVKTHIYNIYQKTGARDKMDLANKIKDREKWYH